MSTETKAVAKYIRMSPTKVRRVLNQIRGKSYRDALMILEFMPYSACEPVLQVLQSAAANAQNNNGLQKNELLINRAFADAGPVLKDLDLDRKVEVLKSKNQLVTSLYV